MLDIFRILNQVGMWILEIILEIKLDVFRMSTAQESRIQNAPESH